MCWFVQRARILARKVHSWGSDQSLIVPVPGEALLWLPGFVCDILGWGQFISAGN